MMMEPRPGEPEYPTDGVDILLDDTHAIMSSRTFAALPEYSTSMPTGVIPGKTWRCAKSARDHSKGWLIGRYDPKDDKTVRHRYRQLIIVDQ